MSTERDSSLRSGRVGFIQPNRLLRTRLNERLSRAAEYPIVLIIAPAGFGKTVALRDFLDTSRSDALRYDVRREDQTLLAFVHGLSEALAPVAPGLASSFPAMQARIAAHTDPTREIADWFAEHLKKVVCSIAIDDLHYASRDPHTIPLLVELIERTNGRIDWVLASRSDAGLPVASWLGYGRIDVPINDDDLRFTLDEALAIEAEAGSATDTAETEALRDLTEGWPIALTIALRTRTHVRDLPSAALGTREMVYRYLAEQVFAALSEEERALLLNTAVFSTFTAATVEAVGANAKTFAQLRRSLTFIAESSPSVFRYHDLFRDFLESELRREGEQRWVQANRDGGALLERTGDDAAALRLYTRAHDADSVLAIVERSGFRLFERGEGELLENAFEIVGEDARASNPVLLGLRASKAAARGHMDVAMRDFAAAIERADGLLRVELVHRYALERVRRSSDAVGLLEPYAHDDTVPAHLRVPILGTLATAYIRGQRLDDALATIGCALERLDGTIDEDARARLYQQAAFVHQSAPGRADAWHYANEAIELALRRGIYDVAARAYSVLYAIVYEDEDDPIESLRILDRLIECAKKSANFQTLAFGLTSQYDIEVDRANDAAIERIESALREVRAALPEVHIGTFLPARALQAAWSGEFAAALALVSEAPQEANAPEWRALRHAEVALYAFCCARTPEGETAYQSSLVGLDACKEPSRRVIWASLILALADLTRGHHDSAHRMISEVERTLNPERKRMRTFAAAVRTLYRVVRGQDDPNVLNGALERLRAEHLGGVARLLEKLPVAQTQEQGGSYSLLTTTEREILTLLAAGTSTKDIATITKRSPNTVDTHIRSICRKLHCRGRREAVALAIQGGWV